MILLGLNKQFKRVIELLENRYIALLFSMIVLILASILSKNIWGYIFAILLAYLIADLIAYLFCRGGKGILQIPISFSNQTRDMGHGYLAFLTAIVLGTVASGYISNIFVNWMNTDGNLGYIVLSNGFLLLLVYFDMYMKFYDR